MVYGVHCTECSSFYVRKTRRHLQTHFKEHLNIQKPSAVTEHLLNRNHTFLLENVNVIATGKSDTELFIEKSLTVKKLKPDLNINFTSYPLETF